MNTPERLEDGEIEASLRKLDGWILKDGKLRKEYKFADFRRAFAFMTAVAQIAEELNHHPEWFNVYATLVVDLATHDAGGVTARDFALAQRMDAEL